MKRDFGVPQYSDIVYVTCLFYPLIGGSIATIYNGVGIFMSLFLLCFFVYLPVASLIFVCIRKKTERARACIVSTFVGLLAVYFIGCIIAYGLIGPNMGLLGAGRGLLILSIPYIISCGIYLFLLRLN